jgi:hypothetical protein
VSRRSRRGISGNMSHAHLGIARDFVETGIEKAGIPLTETLAAYLTITFARFIGATLVVDLLTVRVTRAMDEHAPRETMRALADECLIACALFERRLARNGTVRHYVGLGQATYDAAAMTEQAYAFTHMRDVIAAAAGPQDDDSRILLDRARGGSATAREALEAQNVVLGPWSKAPPGLIWR